MDAVIEALFLTMRRNDCCIPNPASSGNGAISLLCQTGRLTYFPFATVCFLVSVIMFASRARRSVGARWALVPGILFTLMAVAALMIFLLGL